MGDWRRQSSMTLFIYYASVLEWVTDIASHLRRSSSTTLQYLNGWLTSLDALNLRWYDTMIYDAPHLHRYIEIFTSWRSESRSIYVILWGCHPLRLSSSEAAKEDTRWIIFDPEEIILTECRGDIYLLKKWIKLNLLGRIDNFSLNTEINICQRQCYLT